LLDVYALGLMAIANVVPHDKKLIEPFFFDKKRLYNDERHVRIVFVLE
jgi:hypothetical protein